ncbi:LuxR C-terminal-related transcriptional regulator [uncultured Agrococcus sp.]|uniref:helix-turn-helix transcriptional regulator n=1 Tax=uncultured Agrococcus sp. TaxID=382258 RepID=UPI0025DCE564|nr:LuxR C-terminal-related transcriptional regulator [uncultured Agrococcus sp.]
MPVSAEPQVLGSPRLAPATVKRTELFTALDADAPLTIVRAAGGSGKTTLLTHWSNLRSKQLTEARFVWVNFYDSIQSRSGAWMRVLAQLHASSALDDATLYREMTSIADGPDAIPGALRRIAAGMPGPLVLLFDNFGDTAGAGFWDEVSEDLVAILQEFTQVRAVVSGRFPTRLEAPWIGSRLDRTMLGDGELELREHEVLTIAKQAMPHLPERLRSELLQHPEFRHVTTLRSTLDAVAGRAVDEIDLVPTMQEAVRRNLLGLVKDTSTRTFLGATALAPAVDVALAEKLSGRSDAADKLQQLERAGAGQWSTMPNGTQAFTYSDHLRKAAAAEYSEQHPERLPSAQRSIARWLWEVREDALAAFEVAIATGDYEYATFVLMRALPLPQEDNRRVSELLSQVPAVQLHRHPMLALRYALALNKTAKTQRKAAEYFASAALMGKLRSTSTPPIERAIQLSLECAVWRMLGQERRMRDAAESSLEVLEHYDPVSSRDGLQGLTIEALNQCGMSLMYAFDYDRALDARLAYLRVAERAGRPHVRNLALGNIALIDVLQGRFHGAAEALRDIRQEDYPDVWRDSYFVTPEKIARAWLHLSEGQAELARSELAGVEPHLDTIEHWEMILTPLTLADTALGRGREAMMRFERIVDERTTSRTLPWVRKRVQAARALMGMATGARMRKGDRKYAVQELAPAFAAIEAAQEGKGERAVSLLVRAELSATSPLRRMLVAVAGISVSRYGVESLDLAHFGAVLTEIMEDFELRWPLMLLSSAAREQLLVALDDAEQRGTAGQLRQTLAQIPALVPDELLERAPALTPRERDVLHALVTSENRAAVAEQLFTSVNTVKKQLRSIYQKLGVSSREAALARAIALGLIGASNDEKEVVD